MNIWRISDFPNLFGDGGLKADARWHTRGSRIVYLADSSPGALLEVLAHLEIDPEDLPRCYALLRISVPEDLAIEQLVPPEAWKEDEKITREIGDAWLKNRKTALARVPSAIITHSWNYLLNPEHPQAGRIKIDEIIEEQYDRRLFRF